MYRQFVALSGLAMILILLNHSSVFVTTIPPLLGDNIIGDWQQQILKVFQVFGIIAVPIYFVISGSFLAYAFQGITREKGARVFFKFMGTSLGRILLPYVIWSIVFYLVVYWLYDIRFTWLEYGKNLLVGYPYNFVPLLVLYYLLAPLLIWVGRRYPRLLLATIILYQATLLNLLYPGLWGMVFPAWVNQLRVPIIAGTMATWGIYLPIGIVYGLHRSRIVPWVTKFRPVCLAFFLVLLGLAILDSVSVIKTPQATLFCPLALVSLLPAIERQSIPGVTGLEQIGKRAYGFYLMQIVLLDLILWLVHVLAPGLFYYPLPLAILCFSLVLFIPWGLMLQLAKPPTNRIYAFLFG